MEAAAWPEYAVHFGEHLQRPCQVLDGDGYDAGGELVVFEGEGRVRVDVVDDHVVELRVLPSSPRRSCRRPTTLSATNSSGKMRAPATHEVQQVRVAGQRFREVSSDRADSGLVQVDYEPRLRVEPSVVASIVLVEGPRRVGALRRAAGLASHRSHRVLRMG